MLFRKKPENFRPYFSAVGCFIENSGKYVILKRVARDSQGGKWGLPSGKIEKGESPEQAMLREAEEETGICLIEPKKVAKVFVKSNVDFIYYVYHCFSEETEIRLEPSEHEDFTWVNLEEMKKYQMMPDMEGCIEVLSDYLRSQDSGK